MKDLKEHICPSCGGVLRVDIKKQMYECPFCGVTFDYDYFREDSVLDIAEDAVLKGENHSARKAYEFMLTKEPDNFEALRGVSLISLKMAHTEELRQMDKYSKVDRDVAGKEIDRALRDSKPEEREYFELMKDSVDNGAVYTSARKSAESDIEKLKSAKEEMRKYVISNETLGLEDDGYQIASSPKSTIAACATAFFAWFFVVIVVFLCVHTNPYDAKRYVPKVSRQTHNIYYNGSYVTPTPAPLTPEQEAKRVELYNQFKEEHRNDVRNMLIALVVPLGPMGLIILASEIMYRRDLKIVTKLENDIRDYRVNIRSNKSKMKELNKMNIENVEKMKKIEAPILDR